MAWSKNTDPEKLKEYYKKYYQEKRKQKIAEKRAKEGYKTRICPICNSKFEITAKNRGAKYCCEACRVLAQKLRYEEKKSDPEFLAKKKEWYEAYKQTENYKNSQKKYHQSEKFKKSVKKYFEKVKASKNEEKNKINN